MSNKKKEEGEGNVIYIHFIIFTYKMLHISWLQLDFLSEPKPRCVHCSWITRAIPACESPHISAHFNSNMQPVCHHSRLAVVISIFILFLHPDFMISQPQCKSCTALNQPCGKAMLNIYACSVSGSIAIFFSEEFV